MLLLDPLRLNLFLPQRIVIARPIEVDDVIDVLEDRFRRRQNAFANAFEFCVTVTAIAKDIVGDHGFSSR